MAGSGYPGSSTRRHRVVDFIRMSAAELGRAIAAGEATATEITRAHLDRVDAVDSRVHAYLHVDAEGAMSAARAVDDALARGDRLGPLAGVPVAVKDVLTT